MTLRLDPKQVQREHSRLAKTIATDDAAWAHFHEPVYAILAIGHLAKPGSPITGFLRVYEAQRKIYPGIWSGGDRYSKLYHCAGSLEGYAVIGPICLSEALNMASELDFDMFIETEAPPMQPALALAAE